MLLDAWCATNVPLYTSHAQRETDGDWMEIEGAGHAEGDALRPAASSPCTPSRARTLDLHADEPAHARSQSAPDARGALMHLAADASIAAASPPPPPAHNVTTLEASAASAVKEVRPLVVYMCVYVCVRGG